MRSYEPNILDGYDFISLFLCIQCHLQLFCTSYLYHQSSLSKADRKLITKQDACWIKEKKYKEDAASEEGGPESSIVTVQESDKWQDSNGENQKIVMGLDRKGEGRVVVGKQYVEKKICGKSIS